LFGFLFRDKARYTNELWLWLWDLGFGHKTACCVASATAASRRFVGTAQKTEKEEEKKHIQNPNTILSLRHKSKM